MGLVLLLAAAAAFVFPANAARSPQPATQDKPTNDYCLSCHSKPGLTRALPNGEILPLTIDGETFKHSVHNEENIACVACHTNISSFPHPALQADTRRAVSLELYVSCKNCHSEQYDKVLDSVHQKALAAGDFNAAV